MKRFFFLLAATFLSAALSVAQDYALEVLPDKKVIYVDKLNLPDYLYVSEMLCMFPEFASRGDQLYNVFDIQFDGKSVGESYLTVLSQTRLCEIEKIEISSSSVATQQKGEMSGTLNIIPRKQKEGFDGEVSFDGTTEVSLMPSLDLNYRKNKLQLYGHTSMAGFSIPDGHHSIEESQGLFTIGDQSRRKDYFQETARVNLLYNPTERDEIKGWLLESWKDVNSIEFNDRLMVWDRSGIMGPGWSYSERLRDTTTNDNRQLLSHILMQYEHKFGDGSKASLSAGYETSKGRQKTSYTRPDEFEAGLEYTSPTLAIRDATLEFAAGANSSYRKNVSEDTKGSSLYLSPYVSVKYKGPVWSVNAAVRYQRYDRNFSVTGDRLYETSDDDFLGDINAVWQFQKHRAMRFTASRNILRPSDRMMYPRLNYYEAQSKWYRGNSSLGNAYLHTFGIGYVTDKNWNGNSLILNAEIDYTRADGIIEEIIGETVPNSAVDSTPIYYSTFRNTGVNNIGTATVSAIYARGIFSVALSGILFTRGSKGFESSDVDNYYNVSLTPILNLKQNWTVSGNFIYNSPVIQSTRTQGDCFLAQIRVGKKIGNWVLHGEISDIFDYLTTDHVHTGGKSATIEYDLYGRYFGLGFSYRFGAVGSER